METLPSWGLQMVGGTDFIYRVVFCTSVTGRWNEPEEVNGGEIVYFFRLGAQRFFMETNDTKDNYPMNSCDWFSGPLNALAEVAEAIARVAVAVGAPVPVPLTACWVKVVKVPKGGS